MKRQKYDFADSHLWHELQDILEGMKQLRATWDKEQFAEELAVPVGSRVSWKREDDPIDVLDLIFAGVPIFKVRKPCGEIVYALPKMERMQIYGQIAEHGIYRPVDATIH